MPRTYFDFESVSATLVQKQTGGESGGSPDLKSLAYAMEVPMKSTLVTDAVIPLCLIVFFVLLLAF